ncbi:hypothetical protein [Vibrio nitrifigilis]|uniref:Uncharacterized protein n=1 Tax=Vibrio nitrifigilis TaxID=2789781 RepID=A0ABS0GJY3_9VIBR|nr:hypothetical protein [Vibrio nitrifigilis]MBF9002513.1 hypothetical protein [Vibrio nitrifigilis]
MSQFIGPLSFVFIIALAYTLKQIGFVTVKEGQVVNKLLMNLTLPATIIVTFASLKSTEHLIGIALFGFLLA